MDKQEPLKVSDLFNQLLNFTESLSDKINQIKEKNQADFLVAYKNHMLKIKKDLQELKQKNDDHQKTLLQNEKSNEIEKKLVISILIQSWFREESIKLYQKLDVKNKENYELKFQIQQLIQEKEFLEQQTKVLMKRNRELEIAATTDQAPDQTFTTATPFMVQQIPKKSTKRHTEVNNSRYDTSFSSHFTIIREVLESNTKDASGCVEELTQYVSGLEHRLKQQNKILTAKVNTLLQQQTKQNVVRTDLENFFLDCVETIRRDIMKRRGINHKEEMQLYLGYIKDFTIFHKEDKLKILELLLSHEKLLVYLYQKIFPNHFTLVLQQAKDETDIQTVISHHNRRPSLEIKTDVRKDLRSISLKQQLSVKKGKLIFQQL